MELVIREPEVEVTTRLDATPELRFAGTIEASIAGRLAALVDQLHAQLQASNATAIAIDLVRLEFMSATGVNVLARWLDAVRALAPAQQYKLRFVTNPALVWQRATVASLQRFAPELVTIES